jgi:hypothetical protein
MSPFRAACYAAGKGEFAIDRIGDRGDVHLVRVARERPLVLPGPVESFVGGSRGVAAEASLRRAGVDGEGG